MRTNITKLASIAFVGSLVGRGLRYGLNVVIARGLGTDALGVFAVGMVLMKASSVVSRGGLDWAAQKFIPVYRRNGTADRVVGTTLFCLAAPFVVGIVVAIALYSFPQLVGSLFGDEVGGTARLFLVGIPLFSTMMVGVAATKGFKETKYSVYIRELGQSGVAVLFAILGAFVFVDLEVVVLGYLASLAFGVLASVTFLYRLGGLRLDICPTFETREIVAFSAPLLLAAVTQYLVSWTDVLMLGVFEPASKVGWYQAAFQTSVLLLIVLQSMNAIFPSIAADLYDDGRVERLGRVYTAVTKWSLYVTLLGYLFVILYAGDILQLFGTATPAAKTALVVLGLGQTVAAGVGPVGYLLTMSNYERLQFVNSLGVSLLNVGLNFVLIQQFGIVGAASATATSIALLNFVQLAEVRYLLGVQPYSRHYWRGAIAIIVAFVPLLLGHRIPLPNLLQAVLAGTVSLMVFVATVWFFGLDDFDKTLLESIE